MNECGIYVDLGVTERVVKGSGIMGVVWVMGGFEVWCENVDQMVSLTTAVARAPRPVVCGAVTGEAVAE